MDGSKVATIQNWLVLTKVTKLHSFLGLANYYRWFIEGQSKIAIPFIDLLKNKREWRWELECQIAFQRLKDAITLKLVQRLLKLEFPFEVQIDVLNKALRGVLVQKGHPMAFESRKLDVMEQRYSTHEKEMTVDIHYLETWKHYLMGTNFMVVTNNVVNTFFTTQKKLTAKQAPC